jgi:ADP-ribose pyrophosphatase
MIAAWERLESRRLAEVRILSLRQDRVRSPRTGEVHDFYVLEMAEWINVVALTPAAKVVMIHQYRHGTGEVGLEIPGGVVEKEDHFLVAAARRELVEETGYDADEVLPLGQVAPNPALQNNRCHTFLALGARPAGAQRLDAGEDILVEEIELERIPDLIGSGRIHHGLVVAAFYHLEQYLRHNPGLVRRQP